MSAHPGERIGAGELVNERTHNETEGESMTTAVMAYNKAQRLCATHDAEAAPRPMRDTSPEAVRLFIETAFRAAGKPVPTVLDGQAFLQAQYLAQGKPIPKWLTGPATAAAMDSRDVQRFFSENEAAVAAAVAEAVRRSVALQRRTPDPFDGRKVTGVFLTPDGDLVKHIEKDEPQQFAAPTPWHATQLDGPGSIEQRYPDAQAPDGNPHGDEKIIRRRRALELERLIMAARKKANRGSPAERARWDQELQNLSSELEAIREAERQERADYRKI